MGALSSLFSQLSDLLKGGSLFKRKMFEAFVKDKSCLLSVMARTMSINTSPLYCN